MTISKEPVWVSPIFLILTVVTLVFTVGCKSDSNYFADTNSSIGGTGGGTVATDSNFKILLTAKSGVEGFIHKMGTLPNAADAACEISKDLKTTPTSISCLMNMMEYDVWFYGYQYEISIPPGWCAYVEETPNRFFKAEPGYGPSTIVMNTTDGAVTTCTIDGVAGTVVAGGATCAGPEGTFYPTGKVECAYDYSTITNVTPALPNCCGGTGNLQINALATSTGITTSTTTKVTYGGSLENCSESPYDTVESWPLNINNHALTRVNELGSGGLSQKVKFKGILSLQGSIARVAWKADYLSANFYDWDAYQTSPTTWSTAAVIPRAVQPLYDKGRDGSHNSATGATYIGGWNPSYLIKCLNAAGEMNHQVSLYMQSWNTAEEFDKFKGGDISADPIVQGTAGVDCAAVGSSLTCNSFWGFDDLILVKGAGVKTAHVYPYEGLYGNPD